MRQWGGRWDSGRGGVLSSPLLPNPGFIFSRNPWGPGGSPQPCMHKRGTVQRRCLFLLLLLFLTPAHTFIFCGIEHREQKHRFPPFIPATPSLRFRCFSETSAAGSAASRPKEAETAKWNLALNTNESGRRRRGVCIYSCICRDDAVQYTLSRENLHSCFMDMNFFACCLKKKKNKSVFLEICEFDWCWIGLRWHKIR